MKIPELNRRIVVQRNAPGEKNAFGEKAENWGDFKPFYAAREDLRDSEKLAAGQRSASLMARFVLFSTSESRTITPKDRIVHNGTKWEIHGVKGYRHGEFRQYLEITASTEID